jgi:uncharacterized protein with PQ loop repeat
MVNVASVDGMTRGVVLLWVIMLSGCAGLEIPDTTSLFFPRFQRSEVVGFVAGLGTIFAALPDLIKMLKRRPSKGMNPMMAGIMACFQILWIYYGLLIASRPVITLFRGRRRRRFPALLIGPNRARSWFFLQKLPMEAHKMAT